MSSCNMLHWCPLKRIVSLHFLWRWVPGVGWMAKPSFLGFRTSKSGRSAPKLPCFLLSDFSPRGIGTRPVNYRRLYSVFTNPIGNPARVRNVPWQNGRPWAFSLKVAVRLTLATQYVYDRLIQ